MSPLDQPLPFEPADIVAALRPVLGEERSTRIDNVVNGRLVGVTAVLEDLRDPHNAGAALRSAESMGLLAVHLVVAKERFRTSMRVTQGCEKWLEIHRHSAVEHCVEALHERGIKLYAGVPGAGVTLADLDPKQKIALAFGNEHTGLSPELRALADGEFTIPMHGFSQSLNVSVSVAVSLHVATEARRREIGGASDLSEAELVALRARYYAREVRGAKAIVERWLKRA